MRKTSRVVYTALIGSSESLQELAFEVDSGIRYICFTDSTELRSETWEIVLVEPTLPSDASRSSRRYKFLGAPELITFDEWLWIDNRVSLKCNPSELFEMLGTSDLVLALHDHRKSVNEEFSAVLRGRKDEPARVREFWRMLQKESPEILVEQPYWGGVILRKNSKQVDEFFESWWTLVLRYSRRDQLSLNYALSRSKALNVSLFPFSMSESKYLVWRSGREVGRNILSLPRSTWKYSLLRHAVDNMIFSLTFAKLRSLSRAFRNFLLKGSRSYPPKIHP